MSRSAETGVASKPKRLAEYPGRRVDHPLLVYKLYLWHKIVLFI
jgi:hypothetical protein